MPVTIPALAGLRPPSAGMTDDVRSPYSPAAHRMGRGDCALPSLLRLFRMTRCPVRDDGRTVPMLLLRRSASSCGEMQSKLLELPFLLRPRRARFRSRRCSRATCRRLRTLRPLARIVRKSCTRSARSRAFATSAARSFISPLPALWRRRRVARGFQPSFAAQTWIVGTATAARRSTWRWRGRVRAAPHGRPSRSRPLTPHREFGVAETGANGEDRPVLRVAQPRQFA